MPAQTQETKETNTQDYLRIYKEIAQDYLNYLNNKKEAKKLSSWRNFLTGCFYNNAKYTNSVLRDMVAGGVKNNFLFKCFPKSDHANFIALIDRIAKLDANATSVLTDITQVNNNIIDTKKKLLDRLVAYFKTIQTENPSSFAEIKALKRDINHFAKDCGSKTLLYLNTNTNSQYRWYRNNEKEAKKTNNRFYKTWCKRIGKFVAFCAALAGVPVVIAAFNLFALPAISAVFLLKVIVIISELFCAYLFAKNELIDLSKQLIFRRLFSIKNLETKKWELLPNFQIRLLKVLMPFCAVAGFCVASLTFVSVLAFAPALLAIALSLAGFVFCLNAATFFLTIKNVVSQIKKDKLDSYISGLGYQQNESYFCYIARLVLETLKWLIAITVMAIVGWLSFLLFKEKAIGLLSKGFTFLSLAQSTIVASVISLSYSGIKFIFGCKKLMTIMEEFATAIKQYFTVNPTNRNNIQQQARYSESSYSAIGFSLVALRNVTVSNFYVKEGNQLPFCSHSPDIGSTIARSTAGSFLFAINAAPFSASVQRQSIQPLKLNRHNSLRSPL